MKLSTDQIAAVKAELGASPLPPDHPVVPELEKAFGDSTFYLDANGLLVFKPTEPAVADGEDKTEAQLVLVAAWTGEDKKALGMVEPIDTGVVVDLGAPTGGAPAPGDATAADGPAS